MLRYAGPPERIIRPRSGRRVAIAGLALLALMVAAFACGGGEETPQSTATQRSPIPLPTVALPGLPPGSAEQTGLLLYVDVIARQAIALDLSNGTRRPV